MWRRIVDSGLSVREAEAMAGYFKENGTLPAAVGSALAPAAPGRRKPVLPRELSDLQEELRQRFGLAVKLGGDPERGTVTFAYGSAEQLRSLLDRWGVAHEAD